MTGVFMKQLFILLSIILGLATQAFSQISSIAAMPNMTCGEKACEYKPVNIPSSGFDEMIKNVSYEIFGNEYSDNSLQVSATRNSIEFRNENSAIMLSIAKSLVARDKLPTFNQVENSEVSIRFKVIRVDMQKSQEFGYDLTGIFGKGAGAGKSDIVTAAGKGVGFVTSPISSILLNLGIHQAKENGYASENDDIVKAYSNYEDMDMSQLQTKYRSDSAYDSVSESIGWRIGGKVIIGENGIIRINNLTVRYGMPTDSTVSTTTKNTLVESINFSNQVVELPLGYSKILFTREVNLSQNSKKSGMWILSKENMSESRRYKIYFVVEVGTNTSLDGASSARYKKLTPAELSQLPDPTTVSAENFLNSLTVKLADSETTYNAGQSALLQLDQQLLDKAMATKVVSRSIKMIGSKDWIEKLKVFQSQDLVNSMTINLLNPQDSCVVNKTCDVTKYLIRIGLDARVYGESVYAQAAYYMMTFVPNAEFIEQRRITEEEAKNIDKNFVRDHYKAR